MASDMLSVIAQAEAECEEKIKLQTEKAQKAHDIAQQKAKELYDAVVGEAKKAAEDRLNQARDYAGILTEEQQKRTAETIDSIRSENAAKESPAVLAVSKKILELS